jgi:hypothetical protein
MGTALTTFTDGTPIVAPTIRDKFRVIDAWLNEIAAGGDILTTGWADPGSLFPAYFYGSPSPRFRGPASEAFFDATPFTTYDRLIYGSESTSATHYVPIKGLCKRIRVTEASTWVTIKATWYAYDTGDGLGGLPPWGDEATEAGVFVFYIDGAAVTGTRRPVYRTDGIGFYARKQHSVTIDTTLNVGTHDLGVYLLLPLIGGLALSRIFIEPRSITVEADYR